MEDAYMADTVFLDDPKLLSRVLYTNPVCLLAVGLDTGSVVEDTINIMTISWLTPINNEGGLILSMNQARDTARRLSCDFVRKGGTLNHFGCRHNGPKTVFTLSVPTESIVDTVKQIGRCSGKRVNKPADLDLAMCRPGWTCEPPKPPCGVDDDADVMMATPNAPSEVTERLSRETHMLALIRSEVESVRKHIANLRGRIRRVETGHSQQGEQTIMDPVERFPSGPVAIVECCAHLECEILSMTSDDSHWIIRAQCRRGYIKQEYWSGKTFTNSKDDNYNGPLTFLGSQQFGRMQHITTWR